MGIGVVCAEEATISDVFSWGCRRLGASLATSPRSDGEKDTVEQNPSDEVTNNVVPSEDLAGKVRKTTARGRQ